MSRSDQVLRRQPPTTVGRLPWVGGEEPAVPDAGAPPRPLFPVLARPRQLARLSAAVRSSPLTVVWAPAGSGKTTLAATWAARPSTRAGVTWLRAGPDTSPATVLRQLERARAGAGALVVDDAEHLIDPAVVNRLDELVRAAHRRFRIVLFTRVEPVLPMHRYRLDGSVAELGYDDLAMDHGEARALLRLHGVPVSEPTARLLVERTGGWAAGLRIAALAMQRAGGPLTAEELTECLAPAHNLMADYLVAEVVQPMTDRERKLLRDTSVYTELDAAVVDELCGGRDGADVLMEVSRRHAFVRRVRTAPATFRVHPLLRAVLHADAVHRDPAALRASYRRAARWYADRGETPRAVECSVQAHDWARAADLVVEQGLAELLGGPDGAAMAEDLAGVPSDAKAPNLALARAAAAVRLRDLRSARRLLAEAAGQGRADRGPSGDPATAVVATALHRAADEPELTAVAARRARQGLSGSTVGTDPGRSVRAYVLRAEGEAEIRTGRLDTACASLSSAVQACPPGAVDELRHCLGVLALAEAARGRRSASVEALRRAERCGADGPPAPAPVLDVARAWVALERQDLPAAGRVLRHVTRVSQLGDDPFLAWAAGAALERVRHVPADGPADSGAPGQELSAKELEVLQHLARLLTTEEVAAAMFISVNTVKTHVRSILRKLAVSRRNQAVRRAQQLGLV